jgi:hypothetical protein
MRSDSLFSRGVLTLTLIIALTVGTAAFTPSALAFDCGTNAGGGNCKQASYKPGWTTDAWALAQAVFTGLRVVIRL